MNHKPFECCVVRLCVSKRSTRLRAPGKVASSAAKAATLLGALSVCCLFAGFVCPCCCGCRSVCTGVCGGQELRQGRAFILIYI